MSKPELSAEMKWVDENFSAFCIREYGSISHRQLPMCEIPQRFRRYYIYKKVSIAHYKDFFDTGLRSKIYDSPLNPSSMLPYITEKQILKEIETLYEVSFPNAVTLREY